MDWLKRIRELYRLNDQRCAATAAGQRSEADARLRAAVAQLQAQARHELAETSLRLPCRQVLESLLNHWDGLTRFVDDPRIPMDNNRSERQVRGPALGRKNYYGSGAAWSGRLAAMLFSIFATLRHWQLSPRLWLEAYLQACAANQVKHPRPSTPSCPGTCPPNSASASPTRRKPVHHPRHPPPAKPQVRTTGWGNVYRQVRQGGFWRRGVSNRNKATRWK